MESEPDTVNGGSVGDQARMVGWKWHVARPGRQPKPFGIPAKALSSYWWFLSTDVMPS